MKIFTNEQISLLDDKTFELGFTPSIVVMNRAIDAFVNWFMPKVGKNRTITIICGMGNNGADGLGIADKLLSRGYQVNVIIFEIWTKKTAGFIYHHDNLVYTHGNKVLCIKSADELQSIEMHDVIIDAVLGNGVKKIISSPLKELIKLINSKNKPVYSVDIPSGLTTESDQNSSVIRSTGTLAFEYPRLPFFYQEAHEFIPDWDMASIDISRIAIDQMPSPYRMDTRNDVSLIFRPRPSYSHKGSYGRVCTVGGADGMTGAVILAAEAAASVGCGYSYVCSAQKQSLPDLPNLLTSDWSEFTDLSDDMIVAIGPGLGQSRDSIELFNLCLDKANSPLVIDADGLNIVSSNPGLLKKIPPYSVLTPHIREFERLFGHYNTSADRDTVLLAKAEEHKLVIILKGPFTRIASPDGLLYFNTTGNPALAAAGTGDVLTGMIAGFLAQGYNSLDAVRLGVYLHGLAADIFVEDNHESCLTASKLLAFISQAMGQFRIFRNRP